MNPKIGVIMGSSSDWETMKHTCDILDELQVPYEKKVVSAHRTPDLMFEYAATARARGIQVIVAGAGGAAHLPGMVASKTRVSHSLIFVFATVITQLSPPSVEFSSFRVNEPMWSIHTLIATLL